MAYQSDAVLFCDDEKVIKMCFLDCNYNTAGDVWCETEAVACGVIEHSE